MAERVIHTIWAQRECRYEGEFAPELVDAWDEFVAADNWDGFQESVKKAKQESEYVEVRLIDIKILEAVVEEAFSVPSVRGKTEVIEEES